MAHSQSTILGQTFLAFVIIAAFPSFLYRRHCPSVCRALMVLNGIVLGLALGLQEPLILVINPLVALLSTHCHPPKKAPTHE